MVRRPPPSKPIMPSPAPPVDSASVTSAAPVSALAVSASVRAGTSAVADRSDCSRLPRQRADREPVAVGRGEGELVALDLHPDAGEHRQRVVPAGGERHLGDRGGEHVALERAGDGRHRRQRGVVLDRQRREREPRGSAGQHHPGALEPQVDRLGRAASGRCRTAAARAPSTRPGSDRGVHGDLRGHLVVEAATRTGPGAVLVDLEQQPEQHLHRRPGRQRTRCPDDGVREGVTLDPQFHGAAPCSGRSLAACASCGAGQCAAWHGRAGRAGSGRVPQVGRSFTPRGFPREREPVVVVGACMPVDERRCRRSAGVRTCAAAVDGHPQAPAGAGGRSAGGHARYPPVPRSRPHGCPQAVQRSCERRHGRTSAMSSRVVTAGSGS